MTKCVAFISTDSSLLTSPEGQSFARHLRYAKLFDKLTVIVLTLSKGFKTVHQGNLTIIPTNSASRWSYIFDALKILRANQPLHLISAQSPFIEGIIGVLVKFIWGSRLNIQLHIDLYNSRYFREESLQNFIFYLLSFLTIGFADSVRVGSKRLLKGPKVFRAIVPMRLKFFWHKPREKTFNQIVTVARFVKQKNLPLISEIAKRLPNVQFIVIGDGPEKEKLENISNVKILPWKSQAEYKEIFLKSDLYLSTSNYEGWGMSQTEALASGLPLVTTDTGCVGDLIFDNKIGGLVCKQGDVAGLTQAVEKLLQDKKLRKRLVLAAQKKLKEDFVLTSWPQQLVQDRPSHQKN